MPFRLFVFLRRNDATRKDEETKKRHAKRRKDEKRLYKKDEITPCEKMKSATQKDEILARKDEKKPCVKTPFETYIWRFPSCRLFAWRYFVFSRRNIAMRNDGMQKDEKTK